MRFSYNFPPDRIIFALSGVLGFNNVTTENKKAVITALEWHQHGMDFADALHLACSLNTDKFVSFDKKLLKKATALTNDIILIEP